MFSKENSSVSTLVADNNKAGGGGRGTGRGRGGGGKNKKQQPSQSSEQPQQLKKKVFKDVPLRKTDRKRLREKVQRVLFGEGSSNIKDKEEENNSSDGGDDDDQQENSLVTTTTKSLLDDIFMNGTLVSRSIDLPLSANNNSNDNNNILEFRKATLYYRSGSGSSSSGGGSSGDNNNDNNKNNNTSLLSVWPYSTNEQQQQCVWMEFDSRDRNNRRYEWDVPSLALLSVLPPPLLKSKSQIPSVTLKSYAVSKYLCRGAHLFYAGIDNIISSHNNNNDNNSVMMQQVVTVHVQGNPQPLAVGLYHPPSSSSSSSLSDESSSGRGVTILTCYGDDLWKQQFPAGAGGAVRGSGIVVSPYGGAPYCDGNYGNVGFIDGKYVLPLAAQEQGEEELIEDDAEETEEEAVVVTDDNKDNVSSEGKTEEGGVATVVDEEGGTGTAPTAVVEEEEEDELDKNDRLFHEAVCMALVRLQPKKQYLPMGVATFYAKHVLQQDGGELYVPPIKATSYKKLQNYLLEQVEERLITVGPDNTKKGNKKISNKIQPPPDPMAMLIDYNRQHPDLRPYIQQQQQETGDTAATASTTSATTTTRLAIVDLFCVPPNIATILRLDADAVKATNATSAERQGTGMLTLQEMRSLLDTYIQQNDLIDTYDPSQVILDGPLTDALYPSKSKKSNNKKTAATAMKDEPTPTSLSRQDVFLKWKQRMQGAYAVVQVPGSVVVKLGRGSPPTVTIEVKMRQSRKFVTYVSGLSNYNIVPDTFATDVSRRFACAAAVEAPSTTTASNTTASNNKSVVVIQGNLSEQLRALLIGDEKLSSHGGVKNSPYRIPKKAVEVVLRKGVPACKKIG